MIRLILLLAFLYSLSFAEEAELIIVKLGGSAITNKGEFEQLDSESLSAQAMQFESLAPSKYSYIVVHGAGSFGHFQARKFDLGKGGRQADWEEGSRATHSSVKKLNVMVVEKLRKHFISAVGFSLFPLCKFMPFMPDAPTFTSHIPGSESESKSNSNNKSKFENEQRIEPRGEHLLRVGVMPALEAILSKQVQQQHVQGQGQGQGGATNSASKSTKSSKLMLPVLHGDVIIEDTQAQTQAQRGETLIEEKKLKYATIFSGDQIMHWLSRTSFRITLSSNTNTHARAVRAVFVTDVRGVFDRDPKNEEEEEEQGKKGEEGVEVGVDVLTGEGVAAGVRNKGIGNNKGNDKSKNKARLARAINVVVQEDGGYSLEYEYEYEYEDHSSSNPNPNSNPKGTDPDSEKDTDTTQRRLSHSHLNSHPNLSQTHTHDVTGGMQSKLQAAVNIALEGVPSFIVKVGSEAAKIALDGGWPDDCTVVRLKQPKSA